MSTSKTKAWIGAMRLRTLPLAAASILGGMAAGKSTKAFPWSVALMALLTCVLLQILSNLANDLGDYSKGTDNARRVGPTRALQSGVIQKRAMVRAVVLFAALSFFSGVVLLWQAFGAEALMLWLVFLALGLAAIAAAIKYTAGKGAYGYKGFGDVFVLLFFGGVGVCGTAFLVEGSFSWRFLLPAWAIGALSTMVLNVNNLRDHVNDAVSGKRTMVVRLGFKKAKAYHALLYISALLAIVLWLGLFVITPLKWIALLPFALLLKHLITVGREQEPAALDPELKKVALSTFLLSILLIAVQFVFEA